MTNAELSRVIANYIEPFTSFPEKLTTAAHGKVSSPAGMWWRPGHELHWYARDMVDDPAMTVMLLVKLLQREGTCIQLSKWLDKEQYVVRPGVEVDNIFTASTYSTAGELGRATAEAFAKAKGLI